MTNIINDNYCSLNDKELITAIVQGDEQAVVYLLIEKCGSRLKYLTSGKFRTLQLEFEELVSELFIALSEQDWKALREFAGHNQDGQTCRLENYISTIASRRLWKKMDQAVKDIEWILPLYADEDPQIPDAAAEREQLASEVLQAIMTMENPIERAVLLLYKIEGREVHEVAAMLNISPGNVYTRCCRALTTLRTLLEERGDHAGLPQ